MKNKYHKNDRGEWVQNKNLVNLTSGSSEITSWHDVRLQRLDVFMNNGGAKVFYDPQHFTNTSAWNKVPVIFQKTGCNIPGEHPDFTNVTQRTLDPAKYTSVGYLENVTLSETGEPSLVGQIVFNNENCSLLSKANKLSLSTGFSAPVTTRDDGNRAIAGPVQPNHVLVFKRGSCPNCYPNDNGAQFLNVQEAKKESDKMAEEKVEPVEVAPAPAPAEAAPTAAPVEAPKVEEPKVEAPKVDPTIELRKELDAVKAEFATFKESFINLKWQQVKNTLPAGMVDKDHEAASRAMWEKDPQAFVNITNMAVAAVPKIEAKPAEGVKLTNTQKAEEDGFGVISFKPRK